MEGMVLVITLAVLAIAFTLIIGVLYLSEINNKLKVIIGMLKGEEK